MKPRQLLAIVCLILAALLYALDAGLIDDSVIPVPPTPKPTELWAVVVEESADRTPEVAAMLLSPEVRGLFKQFRLIDKDDVLEPKEEQLKQEGIARGLPTLLLVDPSGKVWWKGDVPRTVDDWRKVVAEVKR
jgi:hypothetical protein